MSHDEMNLSPDERDAEQLLGKLTPAFIKIDERVIWFEAGRRRGRRTTRLWAGTAAACVLMTIGTITWRSTPTSQMARQTAADHPQPTFAEPTTVPNRLIAKDQSHPPIDLTHLPGWSEPTTPRGRGVLSQPAMHPGDLSEVGLADS
jgi:hypothetical protein